MMFNRAMQVQMVKTPRKRKDASDETPECTHVDIDKINETVVLHVQNIAKIAGKAYVAKRVLDTACQIAVIYAKKNL